MFTRKLGRSNIEISAMGLGCWAIGGPYQRTEDGKNFSPMGWGKVDDKESIRAIHAGMDAGINLIDTANKRGGHDNTTIVLINVPRNVQMMVPKKRSKLPWIIGGGIALLLILVFASVLTINLLRATIFATPTPTFTASPVPTATHTLPPTPRPTFTETLPATATPVEPTYTPWPTNTESPPGTQTP